MFVCVMFFQNFIHNGWIIVLLFSRCRHHYSQSVYVPNLLHWSISSTNQKRFQNGRIFLCCIFEYLNMFFSLFVAFAFFVIILCLPPMCPSILLLCNRYLHLLWTCVIIFFQTISFSRFIQCKATTKKRTTCWLKYQAILL